MSIGSTVRFHDEEFDEDLEYRIVGSTESDIINKKISNESPIGRALLGSRVGDVVVVESPEGVDRYTILEISREES